MEKRVDWDEALRFAAQKLQKRTLLSCGLIGIPPIVVGVLAYLLQSSLSGYFHLDGRLSHIIVKVLVLPLEIISAMGAINIALKLADDKPAGIDDFFNTNASFFAFIGTRIAVTIALLFGFSFLVIPGLLLFIKLNFAEIALVDQKLSMMKALAASWKLTADVKLDLFIFYLICAAILVTGVVCLLVGVIPAITIVDIARAYIYKRNLLPTIQDNEQSA